VSSEWNDAPDDVEWNEWGPAVRVRVDHAPVALFARAVKDTSAVYRSERAAREAGLRMPEDLALAGFNDTPEAELIGLTTVHVEQEEMGARAASLLIAQLEGDVIAERSIVLPAELVVRGSTMRAWQLHAQARIA